MLSVVKIYSLLPLILRDTEWSLSTNRSTVINDTTYYWKSIFGQLTETTAQEGRLLGDILGQNPFSLDLRRIRACQRISSLDSSTSSSTSTNPLL
jgi:hypothetical protein